MPTDASSTELLAPKKKQRQHKKRRHQNRKNQAKHRNLDGNDGNCVKNSTSVNRFDTSKLTPANLASLRWDDILTDPTLENERIERYKELRRQRYNEARQHAIQALIEQTQLTVIDATTVTGTNEPQ